MTLIMNLQTLVHRLHNKAVGTVVPRATILFSKFSRSCDTTLKLVVTYHFNIILLALSPLQVLRVAAMK
jgi:hypothetical protein